MKDYNVKPHMKPKKKPDTKHETGPEANAKPDLREVIRKHALENARRFNGKASPGAVIGKAISEMPELKQNMKGLAREVSLILRQVNALGAEKQTELLMEIAPELFEKKERKERDIFEFIGLGEKEKVVTAFPPEPSKYPHIGHAKAIMLNYELAKRHNGEFVLRFEDTNPRLAKKEFYEIHADNYAWLGISPDRTDYASDHMKEFYSYAEELIMKDQAYVCSCPREDVKLSRERGIACECRDMGPEESKKRFKEMETAEEGVYILRLKIDLTHRNSTMRDPTIMRIIDAKHTRTGAKYRLWPNYDFENAVMDAIEGITHRLRSKEFEMRNELQRHIQSLLGFGETRIFEFARFNMEGVESSGRIIREKIDNGELTGWDDPSLTTLVALRRRGFVPEAIKSFVLSTGITKAEATLTWDDLIAQNKRILDRECNRYFFIDDPARIKIKNAPRLELNLRLHPDFRERGSRSYTTGEDFYIAKKDADRLEEGKIYRLMDCLNFRKKGDAFNFVSAELEDYKKEGKGMLHWLPVQDSLVKTEVLMPDHSLRKGLAGPLVAGLDVGAIVQFERFGFCRLDDKNRMRFWFTH